MDILHTKRRVQLVFLTIAAANIMGSMVGFLLMTLNWADTTAWVSMTTVVGVLCGLFGLVLSREMPIRVLRIVVSLGFYSLVGIVVATFLWSPIKLPVLSLPACLYVFWKMTELD